MPYPPGGLAHAFPALRPARAFALRIPLGRGPSLHELRRDLHPLVRPLRRYYGPRPTSSLRSSQASVLLPFAAPARLPVRSEDLPGPDEGRSYVHGVSDAAKLPCTSPSRGAGDVAFDELDRLGAPNYLTFGAVRSEDLPGPDEGRSYVHGVSDAAKLPCTSPSRGAGDVAFDELDRLGAPNYLTFGAQYPCPHVPLPTLQLRPHGQRCTARGETRSATPFVSRDSHPLPFTSSPNAPS